MRVELRSPAVERFARAIELFSVEELEVEIEARAGSRLLSKLEAGGPVLAGERHGVEQNPLVALTLMRRFGIRVLALDWSADLQPAVDRFLAGRPFDLETLVRRARGEERVTAGHVAVLHALRAEGLLDRVVLLDPPGRPATWSERDRLMAERLLAEVREGVPALVMAGSLHTRLRRHRHGEPMGAHVARARPGTIELRLRYPSGPLTRWCRDSCALRSAGAWLELTLPRARPAVTAAG